MELLDTATGAVLQSRPLASISGVSIHGLPGQVDDTLTVDLAGGPLALPDGIHFDGGAGGYDSLIVAGGDPAPGGYTVTGPQSGVVTHGGTRITFSNLEPVTDTAPTTNYLITPTADVITLTVADGGTGCSGSCQLTLLTSPSFESLAFAHKTNVSTGGRNFETIIVNNPNPATGLQQAGAGLGRPAHRFDPAQQLQPAQRHAAADRRCHRHGIRRFHRHQSGYTRRRTD